MGASGPDRPLALEPRDAQPVHLYVHRQRTDGTPRPPAGMSLNSARATSRPVASAVRLTWAQRTPVRSSISAAGSTRPTIGAAVAVMRSTLADRFVCAIRSVSFRGKLALPQSAWWKKFAIFASPRGPSSSLCRLAGIPRGLPARRALPAPTAGIRAVVTQAASHKLWCHLKRYLAHMQIQDLEANKGHTPNY